MIPEIVLKKTRQATDSGIIKLVHFSSAYNVADILIKPLPGYVMDKLMHPLLHFDKRANSIFEFVFKGDQSKV